MMQLKSDTLELEGIRFSTQQFMAMRSFSLLARLTKTVGPALGALMKLNPASQLEDVGSELAAAFSTLDPDEATKLVPEILAMTSALIDGKQSLLNSTSAIDNVFSGRLKTMFQVLAFVLKCNYADFMPGSSAPASAALPSPNAAVVA